jgi:hypothetical protein
LLLTDCERSVRSSRSHFTKINPLKDGVESHEFQ